MIEVEDLRKSYSGFEAVRGVSFSVEPGRVLGLLGPNGAGKTTILKVLTGFHAPSSGSARVAGFDVAEEPLEVKRRVGYLPETVPLYSDQTAGEYLDFMAQARGLSGPARAAALEAAAERCGVRDVLPVCIDHLSKGYRQRLALAQAILGDPAILILDEPTTGLDPNQIQEIRSLIRTIGERKTVILSTHILQEVEALCSDVLILNEGVVVARGTPTQIAGSLETEDVLEVLLKGASRESVAEAAARLTLGRLALEPEESATGFVRVRVHCPPGGADDAAEAVSDWALSSGFKIMELKRPRMSMEDIFLRITKEGASG